MTCKQRNWTTLKLTLVSVSNRCIVATHRRSDRTHVASNVVDGRLDANKNHLTA